MFRNDHQRSQVCRALLKHVRLEHLWPEAGPSDTALDYLESSPLSHGEHLMLRVAWDVWNGGGETRLAELLATLDERNLRAVGSLLVAMAGSGDAEIVAWLAAHQ